MYDLDTLTAIEDIRNLEARYARYADGKRWADLADLFTEDGWFRPQDVAGNVIANMETRRGISTSLGSRNSGDVQPIHQLFTHEIDIESEFTAKAIWAMSDFIFRGDSAIPEADPKNPLPPFRTLRGWGHYHVTYKKIEGAWFIHTRVQTRTRLEFTY